MRHLPILFITAFGAALLAKAETVIEHSSYRFEGGTYAASIVRPAGEARLPGIFMVPNWMGVTDAAREKAAKIATRGFVVYIADVYTAEVRPANAEEASAAAGALRADRKKMRLRLDAALNDFRSLGDELRVFPEQYAAIGFCFGGGAILEMARDGQELAAFVSFHGDLVSPTLAEDSENIKGKVLVLHGAADPFVPDEHVAEFQEAMGKSSVDWQFISFSGAVHSFTDPYANRPGQAMYDERTATRAFDYMHYLFAEVFKD